MNYESVIVKKPWGYEYLLFQNEQTGLWFLRLNPGAATSLHCHPRKKTGLVLLSGEVELCFLNDSTRLLPLGRTIIRPGLFHATKVVSPEGAALLEIETPRDKENLVRLEDVYGREAKPYEGSDSIEPLPESFLRLTDPADETPQHHSLEGCTVTLHKTRNPATLDTSHEHDVLIVLDGGLFSEQGEPILNAGDVVSPSTLARLIKSFPAPKGITVLIVSKP